MLFRKPYGNHSESIIASSQMKIHKTDEKHIFVPSIVHSA